MPKSGRNKPKGKNKLKWFGGKEPVKKKAQEKKGGRIVTNGWSGRA